MIRRTSASARTDESRRGRLTALALVLALAFAGFAAWGWKDNPLTARAADHAQDVATASAAVYVTLRTLNSFLSTVEEFEVSGGFIVGGSAQPLKFLEPIDDTVERIASAVFTLMLVSGVLAVAMGPVGGLGWIMVGLAAVMWLAGWLRGRAMGHSPRDGHRHGALGRHLLWYGGFLAVALPSAFLISAQVSDRLTAEAWMQNQAVIDEIIGDVASADPAGAQDTSIRKTISDYRTLAGTIYERAGDLVQSYVALLSIFIFKLFVLPVLIAGGFFTLTRVLARDPGA